MFKTKFYEKWHDAVIEIIMKILGKASSSRHEENITVLYASCPPAMVKHVFRGGREQVSTIIKSLAEICHAKLRASDWKTYEELYSVFITVFSRSVVTQHSYEDVADMLQTEHSAFIRDEETAFKAIAYIEINWQLPEFDLSSSYNRELLDARVLQIKKPRENRAAQDKYLNDPEYGLVKEKPVYTCDVRGSEEYLAGLLAENGQKLKWKRRGSVYVEKLGDQIDVYDSWLPSGKAYKTIYIDMYGTKNSTKAPNGFKKI